MYRAAGEGGDLHTSELHYILTKNSYRDHENYRVEDNCGHDEDFEWLGIHDPPDFIKACVFVLRHVALSWFGCHRELNTVSLEQVMKTSGCVQLICTYTLNKASNLVVQAYIESSSLGF